jgi:hypothetical protein
MDQSCQGQCSTSSPPPAETALHSTHDNANNNLLPFQIEAGLTNLSSWSYMTSQVKCSPTRRAASPLHQIVGMRTLSSSTSTIPTSSLPSPLRTIPKKNSSKPTRSHTSIYPVGASNRNYKKWTTKHQKMSKTSLNSNVLPSSTRCRTSIEPTPPNKPSTPGRTTLPPGLQAYPKPFPSPIGVA